MDEPTQRYDSKNFYGSVVLKDWMRLRDGISVIGFIGEVSILQDLELVGFRAKGNESNWVARIDGPTESVNILGCQIRGIIVHPESSNESARIDYSIVP